ncbi:MAG: amino acid ABC transporter permease [Acidimicrobiales bacterium]
MPSWVGPVASYAAGGLETTVLLAVVTIAVSIVVGTVIGTFLTVPSRLARLPLRLYVEVWRGLPIIVTLFFVFFALPIIGFHVNTFGAAAIGLSLWGTANVAEIVRGAVQSIPSGQSEAAAALGFRWAQRMRYVVLPQAARRTLPPMVSLLTNLTQATTLGVVIGLLEVLEASQRSIERLLVGTGNSHAIAILGAVLVIFFVICFPLTVLSRWLERRLGPSRGGVGGRRRGPWRGGRRASTVAQAGQKLDQVGV